MLPSIKVAPITISPTTVPKDLVTSDFFVRSVDDHWLSTTHREVICLELVDRTDSNWCTLGRQLVHHFLSIGSYIGLSFDGTTIGIGILLPWLQTLAQCDDHAIVDLRMTVDRLPHNPAHGSNLNVTWNSFLPVRGQDWIASLWDQLPSNVFLVGADLLLAAYREYPATEVQWEQHLTLDVFGQSLRGAIGWIVPMEDNIGFLLGGETESPWYGELLDGNDLIAEPI